MGTWIVARKVDESDDAVRYRFGLEERFDRTLIITKDGWDVTLEEGAFDSTAGKIAMKIKKEWQASGEFPPGAVFAS